MTPIDFQVTWFKVKVKQLVQRCQYPLIGAENRPLSQWQKVMYFPKYRLKNPILHLYFDLKRLSKDQFSKVTQNSRLFKEREH